MASDVSEATLSLGGRDGQRDKKSRPSTAGMYEWAMVDKGEEECRTAAGLVPCVLGGREVVKRGVEDAGERRGAGLYFGQHSFKPEWAVWTASDASRQNFGASLQPRPIKQTAVSCN